MRLKFNIGDREFKHPIPRELVELGMAPSNGNHFRPVSDLCEVAAVIQAAEIKHVNIFKLLVKGSITEDRLIDCVNVVSGNTLMHYLSSFDDHESLDKLMELFPEKELITAFNVRQNYEGNTALMVACREKAMKVLVQTRKRSLLSLSSGGLKLKNNDGWTAFMMACAKGHSQVVQFLVESKLVVFPDDWELRDNDGKSALMIACAIGHSQVVEYLFVEELITSDVLQLKDNYGNTALMIACANGRSEALQSLIVEMRERNLLSSDALQVKNMNGRTAFMMACAKDHAQVVQLLIDNQLVFPEDLELEDYDGKSAWKYACDSSYSSQIVVSLLGISQVVEYLFVEELITSNVLQRTDKNWNTAWMILCERGESQLVQTLIDKRLISSYDLERTYDDEIAAWMIAAFRNFQVLECFISNNLISSHHLQQKLLNGMTFVMTAVCGDQLWKIFNNGETFYNHYKDHREAQGYQLCKIFFENELISCRDFQLEDHNGKTALMYACSMGFFPVVQYLIENNLVFPDDFQRKDNDGKTAVMMAYDNGHLKLVQSLIEKAIISADDL